LNSRTITTTLFKRTGLEHNNIMADKMRDVSVAILSASLSVYAFKEETLEEVGLGVKQDEKAERNHVLDSLNILMFTGLLILLVLTIWLFKHQRLRFIHETGLGIIYGLIVGAIITYGTKGTSKPSVYVHLPEGSTYDAYNLPDSLRLQVYENMSNPKYYEYRYNHPLDRNTTGDTELEEKAVFDPEIFFNVLLPPIIFYAGYSLKRRHFFKNFGAIVTFAFAGTIISCFVVGGFLYAICQILPNISFRFVECLYFGAIISATDPVTVLAIFNDLNVDMDLYALVFGESVLNDAVAIVLAGTIDSYERTYATSAFNIMAVLTSIGNFFVVFLGSFALGSAMGCVTAILTKYTHLREHPLLETSLFCIMSYSTFLASEAAKMSGIVAVLFCGICQAHYTYHNLSIESRSRTKQIFELLNFLTENFIFIYIGISTFTYQRHHWNVGFIFGALIAVIIARACNVYPLSFLLNLGRSNKIRYNFQHMMMFSGLRGAIAFALAIRNTSNEERSLILSTTLIIVIATVILCGGLTTPMLQWLKIRVGVNDDDDRELQNFEAVRTSPSEPPPQTDFANHRSHEKAWLVLKWYNIDRRFVKPFLTHARPPLTETLPGCCLPLAKLLTTDQQLMPTHENHARQNEDSDTDLIIDDSELAYGSQNSLENNSNSGNSRVGPSNQLQVQGEVGDRTNVY